MAAILYIIIYLSHIICILCLNTQNNFFVTPILKKLIPSSQYEKYFIDYNINIQLKNENIEKEFLINTSYISNKISFDFSYSGNILSLNDSNFNLLSRKNYNNNILLIRENTTFSNYIIQNKPLIKFISKVIIVPKNIIYNIDIIANYCFYHLSILLIELDENIFNELESYDDNTVLNIISKKVDIFPFQFYFILIGVILSVLFIYNLIYKLFIKVFQRELIFTQKNFYNTIVFYINFKIGILFILLFDLDIFYQKRDIIIEYTSFIKAIMLFLMIISKSGNVYFILKIYYGIGIYIKRKTTIFVVLLNLVGFYFIYYILFNLFINPLNIPQLFFILNLIATFPIFSGMIFFSVKNLIFLIKVYFMIGKANQNSKKYIPGIRLKLFIVLMQFIFALFVISCYLFINNYLLFKKGLCFIIEKDALFQSLDSLFNLLIAFLYFPRIFPEGYRLEIKMIQNFKKSCKINISSDNNYISSIDKENLDTENNIKKYVRDNRNKMYVVLNPKAFLVKNRQDNNIDNLNENKEEEQSILGKNIKIGKLI